MAYQMFGDRLMCVDVEGTQKDFAELEPSESIIKQRFHFEGKTMELLVVKHQTVNSGANHQSFRTPRKHKATLWYVATSSEEEEAEEGNEWLKTKLEMLADFAALPLAKQVARLELLFTPAVKRNGKYLIDTCFLEEDIELIEDSGGDGCGFVPRGYIEKHLASRQVGLRTFGLQVRIFVPKLGIFKGMLMEKEGISLIQLPVSSMRKVNRSTYDGASPEGTLLIKGTFPSQHNYYVAKILRGEEPCKSWEPNSALRSDMVPDVLEDNGVPKSIVSEYRRKMKSLAQTRDWDRLTHSYVVGVADPTGSIPEGHIVVPGLMNYRANLDSLFVTRCPCMRRKDGRLLPLLTSRPEAMSVRDWNFLEGLHFGCIIFGNSKDGRPELASTISDGDLDGDLYFILWNEEMLSHMRDANVGEEDNDVGVVPRTGASAHVEPEVRHPEWLKEAQETMMDLRTTVQRSALIGILHNEAKEARQNGEIRDQVQLGKAYQQALDLKKHGNLVSLPLRLWDKIPQPMRRFLKTD